MKLAQYRPEKNALFVLVVTAAVFFSAAFASRVMAKPGLLLVAHGSPTAEWNQSVLDFGKQVADEVMKTGTYKAVRTGLLEASKPDIPSAIAELEAAGCDRIIAIPLFIAPSGHTHFDVPAALGIYASPKTSDTMAAEVAKPANSHVPITLLQTLSEGDLLSDYALDQVRKISQSPQDEAVVVLAHGDPDHHLLLDRMLRQITTHCCGHAGISYGDWAFIGMGQEYASQGLPAIARALESKKRVLVVGLYVGSAAAKLHARSLNATNGGHAHAIDSSRENDVVFSNESLIQFSGFLPRVVQSAQASCPK